MLGVNDTVDELSNSVAPVGITVAVRLTLPENPFCPVTAMIVDESEDPAGIVSEA